MAASNLTILPAASFYPLPASDEVMNIGSHV